MKNTSIKLLLLSCFVAGSPLLFGQTNTGPNVFPATGSTGIGITTPKSNLHIHGTGDYIVDDRSGSINYGKTSRILMTTTTSGNTTSDGFEIRYTQTSAYLTNKEVGGTIGISTGGASLALNGTYNRIGVGGQSLSSSSNLACFNIQTSTDNGLYIRTIQSGKVGARIHTAAAEDQALVVVNNSNTSQINFLVDGGGQVYARKYTTTLNNIPDYVFEEDYELISLDSLQVYIATEKHLPNVPSATEYEAEGVDLGEMNRILLEKVEELTLYVLQLKAEMEVLKENGTIIIEE